MRDFTVLQGQEFIQWMYDHLTYNVFKDELTAKRGRIYSLIKEISAFPIAVYVPEKIERTQFSSWWRFLQIREYANPYIQDVYYIHELMHMAGYEQYIQKYTADMTFEMWFNYVTKMELNASLSSEVYVYLEYPELRALTFNQEIWADRFIKEANNSTNPFTSKDSAYFFHRRLLAMVAPVDDIEKGIAKYRVQNEQWARIWDDVRHEIDGAMVNFFHDRNIDAWLEFVNRKKNNGNVPFPFQTIDFHAVVQAELITLHKV